MLPAVLLHALQCNCPGGKPNCTKYNIAYLVGLHPDKRPHLLQGEYTVVLVAGGTEAEQLLCLQVDFDVTPPITRAKQSLRRAMSKLGVISRQHSQDGEETSRTAKAHT